MTTSNLAWQIVPLVLCGLLGLLYTRGWLRLRLIASDLARPARLISLWAGLALLCAAHLSPLYPLSGELLFARSILKILTVMVAPPLIWLAAPVHGVLWGLPGGLRGRASRAILGPSAIHSTLRVVTAPGLAWLLFISAFVIWHDARFTNWSMAQGWARHLSLWVLALAALLYWSHVVGTAPRIHARLPLWVFFAYLVGADIPNMVAGVTISFTGRPIYAHYANIHATTASRFAVDVLDDQIIAGGLIWFFGSIVYFGSAVLVMRRLFKHEHPQPFPNWDADERMIAPGLEHRLSEPRPAPPKTH
ncbi:MAG: cytochrome c oxidase assembly protein [Caldilineaceae bacterium]|nr:cytochrome c oxidase assembly protein [Caldilineaceae bacterium]